MGYVVVGDTIHYPDLYTVCYGTHTVHRRLGTQKAYIIYIHLIIMFGKIALTMSA